MSKFGKGWVKDSLEQRARRPLLRGLLGGPARIASAASTRRDIVRIRNQRVCSGCVGMQLARATDTRLAVMNAFTVEHSPMAAYGMGRMKELGDVATLPDQGSQPSLLVEATTEFGLPQEKDWALPDDDIELTELVAKPIPFDVIEKASALHPVAYLIDGEGESRITQLRHSLEQGYPVIFGTEVDRKFEDYTGDGVVTPAGDLVEGGHMLGIDGYDGEFYLGWNSWSEDWGKGGYFACREDFLLDPRAGDFYAIGVSGRANKPVQKVEDE